MPEIVFNCYWFPRLLTWNYLCLSFILLSNGVCVLWKVKTGCFIFLKNQSHY